jgi:hypothetical protein
MDIFNNSSMAIIPEPTVIFEIITTSASKRFSVIYMRNFQEMIISMFTGAWHNRPSDFPKK